jgi:hypothetical protein
MAPGLDRIFDVIEKGSEGRHQAVALALQVPEAIARLRGLQRRRTL